MSGHDPKAVPTESWRRRTRLMAHLLRVWRNDRATSAQQGALRHNDGGSALHRRHQRHDAYDLHRSFQIVRQYMQALAKRLFAR
jgi:hypothetical protein